MSQIDPDSKEKQEKNLWYKIAEKLNETPNTDPIKKLIRRNYATADVWLNGVQVVKSGVWLGREGRALLEEKVQKHIKWMRKHPERAKQEALV